MRKSIVSSLILIFAVIVIVAAFTFKYWLPTLIADSKDWLAPGNKEEIANRFLIANRTLQVVIGLVLAWIANIAPKHLTPLDEQVGNPASGQRVRRFSSTVVMLGGLLYALTNLLAPMSLLLPLSVAVLGCMSLLVIFRFFAAFVMR